MCADAGVPFLGRVPLDPRVAAAGERGASILDGFGEDESEAGAGGAPARRAVRAVVEGVKKALAARDAA